MSISIEGQDSEPLPNPHRGCGTLKRGKAYLVGAGFSEDGVLPSWVELDPHLPFREIGTDGQFTRSFKRIDGLTLQLALEEHTDFIEHYPNEYVQPTSTREELLREARENHVEHEVYGSLRRVPKAQSGRHVGRVRHHGTMGGEHWGDIDHAEQTDLLMRCGETYYPEAADFALEATKHGLSKAIPVSPNRDPPVVVPGVTRCWIMHPSAGDGYGGAIIGFAYLSEVAFAEPEDGQLPDYIEEYDEAGKLAVRDIEPPQEPVDVDKSQTSVGEWEKRAEDGDGE